MREKFFPKDTRFGYLTVIKALEEWYEVPSTGDRRRYYLCKCDCGKEIKTTNASLRDNKATSCGCKRRTSKVLRTIVKGQRIGKLTVMGVVLEDDVYRLLCKCDCGNEITTTGHKIRKHKIMSCGCAISEAASNRWKGYGEISGDYWSKLKKNAVARCILFDITIEQAWELFLKQNRKCALTGWDLKFAPRKGIWRLKKAKISIANLCTASLDRIDSNKDYTIDNVQWVHKDIQFVKNKLNQNYFIGLCEAVAKYSFNKFSTSSTNQVIGL